MPLIGRPLFAATDFNVSIEEIAVHTFKNTPVKAIVLPVSLGEICESTFMCVGSKAIAFPSKLREICESLTRHIQL